MTTKPEKFLSLSESTKNSLVNLATRRQWTCTVHKVRENCYDVTVYVPKGFTMP